ncbi:endo-1,4-beta-xylanase [Cyanobium sp. Candia 9D4]|uniref:endo-1,4-beta-xylanase n=1 Tax=Cyanobium sp. Candia 9D4 TaxID=2823707 RepID=UPI0020CD8D15|nr:endo-1,4-beta-xylanase [Cyanobium sp. Candia 9D4]MCP9933652.1 endo-1,4-beta-xylanase [Cyanobium sp. Candia 9D4]
MRRRQLIVIAVVAALGWSVARALPPPAAPTLQGLAAARGLRWGSAVTNDQLRDPGLRRLVSEQSGLIVPESELKWDGVEAAPGRFDFSAPDRLLAFARAQGLAMRGHTLVWHEQLPAWVKALPPAELDRAMATYIRTVVGHYRGQLPSWDVVNEPIADDGSGLRRSLWLARLGPDYIARALTRAHQADPKAALVINEYGLEGDDAKTARKRQAFLTLLRQLRQSGVPLNAVGLQAHLYANGSGPTTFRTLPAFLRELAALDLDILVTELDVNDRELPAAIPERDRAVAAVYGAFLAAVLPEPRLKLITTWGLSDRTTWLNAFMPRADGLPQRPLPFDEDNRPKAATATIQAALEKR